MRFKRRGQLAEHLPHCMQLSTFVPQPAKTAAKASVCVVGVTFVRINIKPSLLHIKRFR